MRNSLFPGEVDWEWLAYLAEFPPLPYVLAQHSCAGALDSYQARECQIIYDVYTPSWMLQWVQGDPWDEQAADASLEDLFGEECEGLMIDYCPFCGERLPDLENDTCLDPWHGTWPITMRAVADAMQPSEESSCK